MNDLLVIIVIYNKPISDVYLFKEPDLFKIHNLDVFIYDNSFKSQVPLDINGINIKYVHNEKNAGVSTGYNSGIKEAKELEKKYVILLDQDSQISLLDFKKYLLLYDEYGDDYIYAPIMKSNDKIYSPAYLNHFAGKVQLINSFQYNEEYSLEDKSLINSGLLIPLSLLKIIGTFNEKIKLDFSDFYFIEKYKKINKNIILLNLYIEHSLSGDDGKNYKREMLRYKYYCNGAKFFTISSGKLILFPVLRRMLKLIVKYGSLMPIHIFINYFLRNKII